MADNVFGNIRTVRHVLTNTRAVGLITIAIDDREEWSLSTVSGGLFFRSPSADA